MGNFINPGAPADTEAITTDIPFDEPGEEFSPIHRINGYPWRLRVVRGKNHSGTRLLLICDKSNEAELWECTATVTATYFPANIERKTLKFSSWDTQQHVVLDEQFILGRVDVFISTNNDGESWTRSPCLDFWADLNGILSIGDEKKRIRVNKEFLSAQSPFFDRLFNSDFKEKSMKEIPIGDVEYEDLSSIISMVYGFDAPPLTMENVCKVLELADRFELKIVQEKAISFLLHPNRVTHAQLFLISQQYNIPLLMELVLSQYTDSTSMAELCYSPEWNQLSMETVKAIFKKCCTLAPFKQTRDSCA